MMFFKARATLHMISASHRGAITKIIIREEHSEEELNLNKNSNFL